MRKEKIMLHMDPEMIATLEREVERRSDLAGANVPRAAVLRDLIERGLRDALREVGL